MIIGSVFKNAHRDHESNIQPYFVVSPFKKQDFGIITLFLSAIQPNMFLYLVSGFVVPASLAIFKEQYQCSVKGPKIGFKGVGDPKVYLLTASPFLPVHWLSHFLLHQISSFQYYIRSVARQNRRVAIRLSIDGTASDLIVNESITLGAALLST